MKTLYESMTNEGLVNLLDSKNLENLSTTLLKLDDTSEFHLLKKEIIKRMK